jgi:HK97 family phage major capsid protein
MNPTEQVIVKIEELGNAAQEKISEVKRKQNDLDDRLLIIERKAGTSNFFSGASTADASLKSDVTKALSDNSNATELKAFIGGTKRSIKIETKDVSLTNNYTGALNGKPIGIIAPVSAPCRVADLLPRVAMDAATLPIIQETGVIGAFTPVAEGALKPLIDFTLSENPARAEVIAGIAVVTRQFIEDLNIAGVSNWLNTRLVQLYEDSLADQILNGNGVAPNLVGMNRSSGFTAANGTVANDLDQVINAILQMRSSGRRPTGVIVNPNDLGRILLNRASGSGSFDVPSYVTISSTGDVTVLGTPVIAEPGQLTGRFNVIDGSRMLLGIREGFRIQFFEQDGSNVRLNKITIRGESRVAFVPGDALNIIQGTF